MTEGSDEQLVSIFQETGDSACFGELVGRHAGRVRAIVLGMVRSDADADDVTQEIFIRAARGLARFRAGSQFKTWLYRIMMNTTRSFLRGRSRRTKVIPERRAEMPDAPDSGVDRPDRRVMSREMGEQLEMALEALPTHLRAAMVMTVLEGVEVTEAARIEGCASATIHWRVHRARRLLRDALPGRIQL
jgi:RNA polymerase sigma-70 factor (ECF subfamily)